MSELTESKRVPEDAIHTCVISAGDHWMRKVEKGQTLRILDLEGNQAVDTLFYNANDTADRYHCFYEEPCNEAFQNHP